MLEVLASMWGWLYEKVKAMILGYVFGGGLVLGLTALLNAADTTNLSPSQQAMFTMASAMVIGLANAIRRPETRFPESVPTPPDQRVLDGSV